MTVNKTLIVRVKPNGTKEFRMVRDSDLSDWLSRAGHWHEASVEEKKEWEKKKK